MAGPCSPPASARPRGFSMTREVCFRGHPFTPENTYTRPNGARWCRIYGRTRDKKRRDKKRASLYSVD